MGNDDSDPDPDLTPAEEARVRKIMARLAHRSAPPEKRQRREQSDRSNGEEKGE